MLRATTACTFSTAQRPKVLRQCFAHFDLHTCFAPAACIFSTSTPRLRCLEHFDFKMCFAKQPDFGVPFLIPSDCSHLCFSICQYCQKFDFKTSFYHHTHTRAHISYIYISISIFTYVHITGRARSELLDADAPSEADVEVTDYDRSLIRIGDLWIRWPPRPLRIPTKHKVVVHQ